jgi:hypothetical protein
MMKKIAIVAVAALVPMLLSTGPSLAATKHSPSVCANAALSKAEKSECKSSLAAAKTKSAKAKVREEYEQKVAGAKHAK